MASLYKYIADPGALRFLLRGTCKFTPIAELNDPSELVPNVIVEEIEASRTRMRRNGYTKNDMLHLHRQANLLRRLAPAYLAANPETREQATSLIRSAFYDDVPRLVRLLNEAAREMLVNVGLFCLSRRLDSLPMWAHYAANAAGLVVEFADLDGQFRGDDTGVLRQPHQVRYERQQMGWTFDPPSHESLFFTKFQDWSYEQEVRIVLPLSDCRKEAIGGKNLYLFDVPPGCVVRLILGWNMVNDKVEAVSTQVRTLNPQVEIVRARFAHGRVELGP